MIVNNEFKIIWSKAVVTLHLKKVRETSVRMVHVSGQDSGGPGSIKYESTGVTTILCHSNTHSISPRYPSRGDDVKDKCILRKGSGNYI